HGSARNDRIAEVIEAVEVTPEKFFSRRSVEAIQNGVRAERFRRAAARASCCVDRCRSCGAVANSRRWAWHTRHAGRPRLRRILPRLERVYHAVGDDGYVWRVHLARDPQGIKYRFTRSGVLTYFKSHQATVIRRTVGVLEGRRTLPDG